MLLRHITVSLTIISLLTLEIVLTYKWQQYSDRHISHLALVLGAVLTPSLYIFVVVARSFACPQTQMLDITILGLPTSSEVKTVFRHLLVCFILSVIGLLVVASGTSATSAWCCVRPGRRLQLCDLAVSVAKVFNENGIDYHVTCGSLLGYFQSQKREKKEKPTAIIANMIPWEHDFDIAIAEDQKETAFALLEKLGFTLQPLNGGIVAFRIHLPGANIWASAWAMTWIDVYPFVIEGQTEEIISRDYPGHFGRPLVRDVKPYVNISLCGFDSFASPRLPLLYIKKLFGPDWQTTKFPNNHRNFTCRLFRDC